MDPSKDNASCCEELISKKVSGDGKINEPNLNVAIYQNVSNGGPNKSSKIRNPEDWLPFSTSTSRCNCKKYDIKDLPQLEVSGYYSQNFTPSVFNF